MSKKLTDMQEMFCLEYLVDLNATQAAIRAGYSKRSARQEASRLLTNDDISGRVKELMAARSERVQINGDQVIKEIAKLAFSNMKNLAKWNASGVTFLDSDELTDDTAAAVVEVSETTNEHGGSLKVKQHDKVRALELLGRHLKLFTDKQEITGKDGGPIHQELTDEQLDARLKAIMEKGNK